MIKGSMTVKALFSGIGMAAVAGLLVGGAMKPDLGMGDRPEGPQIFAGWSGVRSTGPFDPGMTFADYQGQIPDYVIGSDWKAMTAGHGWKDDIAYEPAPTPNYYEQARAEPEPYPTRWEEPPRKEPLYPSMSGGVAYDASARVAEAPPAPPPSEQVDLDEEAPPEATGDTSPAV